MIESDGLLMMLQQKGESTQVVEIIDADVRRLRADSFLQPYKEHPSFVEDQLFPLLNAFGIITPFTRQNRFVARSVLHELRSATADSTQQAESLIR